jgi:hypothetical protein
MSMLHLLSSFYLAAAGIGQPAPAFLFNNNPVVTNETKTVYCQVINEINVLSNDYDPDGDPLTLVSVSSPGNYGTPEIIDNLIIYSPAGEGDFSNTEEIYYTVSDGHGGTANGTLTVHISTNPSYSCL